MGPDERSGGEETGRVLAAAGALTLLVSLFLSWPAVEPTYLDRSSASTYEGVAFAVPSSGWQFWGWTGAAFALLAAALLSTAAVDRLLRRPSSRALLAGLCLLAAVAVLAADLGYLGSGPSLALLGLVLALVGLLATVAPGAARLATAAGALVLATAPFVPAGTEAGWTSYAPVSPQAFDDDPPVVTAFSVLPAAAAVAVVLASALLVAGVLRRPGRRGALALAAFTAIVLAALALLRGGVDGGRLAETYFEEKPAWEGDGAVLALVGLALAVAGLVGLASAAPTSGDPHPRDRSEDEGVDVDVMARDPRPRGP